MIRVELPWHLRNLAKIEGKEVRVTVDGVVTQRSVLNAVEAAYPVLRGTIREHTTFQRRAFLRIFACREDISHDDPDAALPDDIVNGKEALEIIGAIAGG
jgi:molybdopterin synthase sulfur carrier subunit